MPVDFFDVDQTILSGSSGADFVLVGVRRGVFPPTALGYIPLVGLQLRLGLLRADFRDRRFSLLQGRSRTDLEALAAESYRRSRRRVFPQARAQVRASRERGRRVALATSSLDLIVRPLADELGIEDIIASSLEFRDGLCTGRFLGEPLLRDRKRQSVLRYLGARGEQVKDCAFYTDSVNDLSLLEAVGEPVTVNPDPALRRLARRRGWPVLHWTRGG